MVLQVWAVFALALLCGSELNVAAFAHPKLNQQPRETRSRLRSALAAVFGGIMPFWMAGSALLSLTLLFEHLNRQSWCLAAIAFAIQLLAVLLSLIGPVG